MQRVLILGGGFGGLATAHTLRELRPDDEIIVVDRGTRFIVGFRKTWALLGISPLEDGQGYLPDLEQFGIPFRQGTVTAIEPEARAVTVDGERLEADAVVVALGSRLATELVPGFEEHVLNLYDPDNLDQVRQALESFSGGRVGVGVFGLPYKCPPAPYEIAILVQEFFREREVAAEVEVFTPLPMSLPIVGEAGCGVIEGRLAEHGVAFHPSHTATAVEGGDVVFGSERRAYDLILGVPAHRCPAVVAESGLTGKSGWIEVNARTLETGFPGVYAIGDVTAVMMSNGKPLPMAGVFAEGEGRVVAQRIAAAFDGREAQATFDGNGGCFLEVGNGEAMMVEGQFLAEPHPEVALSDAHARYLNEKEQFEKSRLQQWFGKAA